MNAFWSALGRGQKFGFALGVVLIAGLAIGAAVWLWRDPWVPIASGLQADRVVALTRELGREKIEHRIAEDGASVEVHASAAGRARAAAATGGVGLPPSVGLEIFKETDFSTTDFAQRINYQRALQGELTRTLQTIAGVRQARVHVVLPESSVLKRGAAKASAAVTLALMPGKTFGRSQVRGVQRLVAASVPEIKVDDVVVLDESGASLARDAQSGEGELSSSQLELKRQVDAYLESKLMRLLEELAPGVQVTLSVDAVLEDKQTRVTIDAPIVAQGGKDDERAAGVVAKERQRSSTAGASTPNAAGTDTSDFEIEYKVGHRVEQSLLAPGTIRRVSVAVALHGAPPDLRAGSIEALVAHAVGLDRQRGDAVMVMLLERAQPPAAMAAAVASGVSASAPVSAPVALAGVPFALAAVVLGLICAWGVSRVRRERAERAKSAQLDEVADQIREWLAKEPTHASRP